MTTKMLINLGNELRSIKIGKMTINEYCTKIKSMADRLKNLGCVISEKNLVIYMVNGLDSRFATLVEIIRHRKTLPTFEIVRNMLLLKESSFNDQPGASTPFESSSSSPTILKASTSSDTKGKPQNLHLLANHFNKGTCKFRDRCKFIHDRLNRAGLTYNKNNNTPSFGRTTVLPNTVSLGSAIVPYHVRQAQASPPLRAAQYYSTPTAYLTPVQYTTPAQHLVNHPAQHLVNQQAQPFVYAAQQPQQDFLTRHILLQCDSSGDLYPVTKPSNIPATFVSTSSSIWNQNLGHPGEVFCSLTSRHFISCNKEKSTHVCHAC
ncbi:hybrid signal transduction histidine kinase M [Tanacetum coccineum]